MNSNGARPEHADQREIRLRCKDTAGVAEYTRPAFFDRNGKPIEVYDSEGNRVNMVPNVLRRRCKNQHCCPRLPGQMAVHRWILWGTVRDSYGIPRGVGEYITEYVPDRSPSEILG